MGIIGGHVPGLPPPLSLLYAYIWLVSFTNNDKLYSPQCLYFCEHSSLRRLTCIKLVWCLMVTDIICCIGHKIDMKCSFSLDLEFIFVGPILNRMHSSLPSQPPPQPPPSSSSLSSSQS